MTAMLKASLYSITVPLDATVVLGEAISVPNDNACTIPALVENDENSAI